MNERASLQGGTKIAIHVCDQDYKIQFMFVESLSDLHGYNLLYRETACHNIFPKIMQSMD